MATIVGIGEFVPPRPPAGARLYDGFGVEEHPTFPVEVGTCRCNARWTVDLCAMVLTSDYWSFLGTPIVGVIADSPLAVEADSRPTADDAFEIARAALDRVVERGPFEWGEFDGRPEVDDPDGLNIYARVLVCPTPACGATALVLVAYGEWQPARWVAERRGHFPITIEP